MVRYQFVSINDCKGQQIFNDVLSRNGSLQASKRNSVQYFLDKIKILFRFDPDNNNILHSLLSIEL